MSVEITIHHVKKIELRKVEHSHDNPVMNGQKFTVLYMTITDRDGTTNEVKVFPDKGCKLSIAPSVLGFDAVDVGTPSPMEDELED